MKNIKVNISKKSSCYPIAFQEDFISLKAQLELVISGRKVCWVTDENVKAKTGFFDDIKGPLCVLKPGESNKIWSSVDQILNAGFEADLGRDAVFVAVGGGVVGDMTGFAASIYLRGVNFIQVPTTLLSMVDASVGGKTGIDCAHGKNLIGTITQPEAVLPCPEFLETLEDCEIQNGIAEMVKHGIIADPRHFQTLESLAQLPFVQVREGIVSFIGDSIKIKKKIVEKDEREAGIRGFLNLGHTFGHAIELVSNFEIPHGRAVAIGCVMASQYALEQGLCEEETVDRIENIFHAFGVDLTCDIPEDELWAAMRHDKKKKDGKIRLILPSKVGKVQYFEVS